MRTHTPTNDIFAALVAGFAFGQMSRRGPFHAFRQAWWDDTMWVPECNRHVERGDLELASLDSRPGPNICGQAACQTAVRSWERHSVEAN